MPGEGTKPKTERVKDQKGKTDSKGKEDYSLPPSAHVLERDRKSSTPKKSPEPKDVAAKDIDEDELDKELQETEKSILEISSQLEELEKQRRIKQKMSKLGVGEAEEKS